jgi:hypothetical protein
LDLDRIGDDRRDKHRHRDEKVEAEVHNRDGHLFRSVAGDAGKRKL